MKKTNPYGIGLAALAILLVVVGILMFLSKPPEVKPIAPPPVADSPAKAPASPEVAQAPPAAPQEIIIDMPVEEIRHLPETVSVPEQQVSSTVKDPGIPPGNRRIANIKKITSSDKHGPFISPRPSPDGLQMLVTRPGFSGIFVMAAAGGDAVSIADANAFNAKWTKDGKIQVIDSEGNRRTYATDGTLESTEPYDKKQEPVYSENDTVYIRPGPDQAPVPLTSSDDRYFNPVVSPDGKTIVYQGLYTGLYMSPADGSQPPRFIGEGNNPSWRPDSSGVVFDVTSDDGHDLTGGHLYYVDVNGQERTNLTPGDDRVSQMPSVGAGGTVFWESNGEIFTGELQ